MNFNLSILNKSLLCALISVFAGFAAYAHADYTTADIEPFVYTAPVLADGSLIVELSFDEIESLISHDSSGNSNDAILSDDSVWAPGISGSAISFDGGDNRALIPNDVIGTGSVTVCAEYNVNSTPAGVVLISNNAFSVSLNVSGNFTVSNDGGTNSVSTTGTIVPGSWNHICVARTESGDVSIYINGSLNVQGNAGTPVSGTEVGIGNSPWDDTRGFDGMIDDVKIYTGILSASQISSI
ncbi:MAG: LamG domain-containing protein [Candidatus Pacebacteria bacterium]|nr:LamG domain-containing protein [Candidatus Paceibacterota bacterium]